MRRIGRLVRILALIALSVTVSAAESVTVAAAATVTLSAPKQAVMREEIAVRYEGPADPGDFVTFVTEGGLLIPNAPRGYPNDRAKGTLTLQAPEKPGAYRIAYVNGGKLLASAPIQVAGASASLAVPERVRARQPFEVAVEGPANPGDFLTLGDAKGTPLNFAEEVPLRGRKRDSLRMNAPPREGEYTVVYQAGGTVLATAPLKVQAADAAREDGKR